MIENDKSKRAMVAYMEKQIKGFLEQNSELEQKMKDNNVELVKLQARKENLLKEIK